MVGPLAKQARHYAAADAARPTGDYAYLSSAVASTSIVGVTEMPPADRETHHPLTPIPQLDRGDLPHKAVVGLAHFPRDVAPPA